MERAREAERDRAVVGERDGVAELLERCLERARSLVVVLDDQDALLVARHRVRPLARWLIAAAQRQLDDRGMAVAELEVAVMELDEPARELGGQAIGGARGIDRDPDATIPPQPRHPPPGRGQ